MLFDVCGRAGIREESRRRMGDCFDCVALLHCPVDYTESHSAGEAAPSVVAAVPLGLLWGYLAHRTGSFLPSMLLNGLNFRGVQNL